MIPAGPAAGDPGGAAGGARPAGRARAGRAPVAVVAATVGSAVLAAVVAAELTAVAAPLGVAAPGAAVRAAIPAARALLEIAATIALGAALLPTLMGGGRAADRAAVARLAGRAGEAWLTERAAAARGARAVGLVAAATWLAAAIASLVLLTAELRPGTAVTAGAVAEYARTFGTGRALVIGAVAAVACGLVALAGERVPSIVGAVLAAAGLVPLVLAGHASGGGSAWHTVMADLLALHVLAGAAWVGGLVVVVALVARRSRLLAVTLPRFSTIAGACLLAVTVTGAANAAIELWLAPGTPRFGDYGVLVAAKAACLAAAGALAWHVRRLLPAIRRGRGAAVVAWAGAELTLLGVAFGLAAALARTGAG